MPIPKNWTEELVYEWLMLEGYLAECNLRLKSSKGGGIPEADVVGVKFEDGRLKIVHAEVGSLVGGIGDNLERVRRKFEKDRTSIVKSICKERVDVDAPLEYRKVFVASYASQAEKLRKDLKRYRIEFKMLDEFIGDDIVETIDQWKTREADAGRRKSKENTTLPESYWLLGLVDFVSIWEPFED